MSYERVNGPKNLQAFKNFAEPLRVGASAVKCILRLFKIIIPSPKTILEKISSKCSKHFRMNCLRTAE